MIVCSCNVISDREIKCAAKELRADDPNAVLTPVRVYRRLGQRPRCGTCLNHVVKILHETFPQPGRKNGGASG